ncbi:HNH/ENDO VII family nuclease, partial [Bacillus paralicheniformis]
VGTSIVGSKGVDKAAKAAKATKASKKVSKQAPEKSVASFKKSMQRVTSNIKGIQIHNPFALQIQLAGGGKVPYHALNGEHIKDSLIQFAKKVSDISRKPFTGRSINVPWLNKERFEAKEIKGHVKARGEIKNVGRRVYTLKDIDINQIDETGKTNLQRMKKGKPPYAKDRTLVNLHHLIQEEPGPIAEIPESWHKKYYKVIHGLKKGGESFRNDPVLESQYDNFRTRYWKWRAKQFEGRC